MSRSKAQRGPLLSSVVMVMLATAATGLLVIIGFQGLPDTVIPSNFGGGDGHERRNVDVSESPTTPPEAKPSTVAPTSVAPATTVPARPTATSQGGGVPRPPVSTGSNARPTAEPTKPPATAAPPKKTTSPSPSPTKVAPSPSSSTQAPTPAPTCGTGRKPRCPKSPSATEPAPTSTRTTYSAGYGESSYDETPRVSSTKSDKKKATPAAKKSGKRKAK